MQQFSSRVEAFSEIYAGNALKKNSVDIFYINIRLIRWIFNTFKEFQHVSTHADSYVTFIR